MMMMMTMTTTMMMIVKKCPLLQNLQAFLDLDIVGQEIQICCHGGGHPSNVTESTVEDLHKIGRDGTIRTIR
jgi:uridine phosphorylase